MSIQEVLWSQYEASLRMLEQAVETCPEQLWLDGTARNPFWRLIYHTTFYTHLYLSGSEEAFIPWEKGRANLQFLGPLPWSPHDRVDPGPPYAKSELQRYVQIVREQAEAWIGRLDLDAASAFEWIPFSNLELLVYNLRHLQHHVGQLADRVTQATGTPITWVGYGTDPDV